MLLFFDDLISLLNHHLLFRYLGLMHMWFVLGLVQFYLDLLKFNLVYLGLIVQSIQLFLLGLQLHQRSLIIFIWYYWLIFQFLYHLVFCYLQLTHGYLVLFLNVHQLDFHLFLVLQMDLLQLLYLFALFLALISIRLPNTSNITMIFLLQFQYQLLIFDLLSHSILFKLHNLLFLNTTFPFIHMF